MIAAVLSAAIVVAIATPIVAALVGTRLRWSIVISLVPGAVLVLATIASTATAWGSRTAAGSENVSNAGALLVAGALALMAGVMGVCIASVVTRVRRGNGWSRRA
ncbi:MAG: hypothetical protein QOH15_1110 [Gaiellales bacterium]|jgi:hypothetical protein|nr:hypothetical protein [Gaiellales bacterium]